MTYYARVTFESNSSVAVRHDDEGSARQWIEAERERRPQGFKAGQVVERGTEDLEVVAILDRNGWSDTR
jgi:hypothetical protein